MPKGRRQCRSQQGSGRACCHPMSPRHPVTLSFQTVRGLHHSRVELGLAHNERSETMLPIRTILHPTDFSEQAANAFELTCALARDYSANVILLHVLPVPVVPVIDGGVFPVPMEVPRQRLQAELDAI